MPKVMRHHTPISARIVAVVLSLALASGAAWYFNSISDKWINASDAQATDVIQAEPSAPGSLTP